MLKRTIGSALLLLALMPLAGAVMAQQATMGYTNQEAILANMPEMDSVQAQLEEEARAQQKEFQQEQQEFQEQLEQYQQQQALLSDERRAEREQELQQLQQKIQESRQRRQQQLAQREAELMQPLLDELQSAINTVAAQRGLDLVLRSQALLYVDENNVVDVTPDVAAELGIDLQQQPGEPGPSVENVETPASSGGGGN